MNERQLTVGARASTVTLHRCPRCGWSGRNPRISLYAGYHCPDCFNNGAGPRSLEAETT